MVVGNPSKAFGLQGSTPHQHPVDIAHAHQLINVAGFDGAAVLNHQIGGAHPATDQTTDAVGFFGCAGLACANRPDRFVGHHQFLGIETLQALLDLTADHPFSFAPLALLIAFANANDRNQTVGL